MNDFAIPGITNHFGLPPATANLIRPHKRPLSSMTPLIATRPDGTLFAVVGAAGGSRITTSATQCLWHAADHNMTMTEALRHGRLHDQLLPDVVKLERRFPDFEAVAAALRDRGHEVVAEDSQASAVQAVARRADGSFEAVGEPRQANGAGFSV